MREESSISARIDGSVRIRCAFGFSADFLFEPETGRELASPSANIPNASYDLLMKSTSEKLLIRTPHDATRLCQVMLEQKGA